MINGMGAENDVYYKSFGKATRSSFSLQITCVMTKDQGLDTKEQLSSVSWHLYILEVPKRP